MFQERLDQGRIVYPSIRHLVSSVLFEKGSLRRVILSECFSHKVGETVSHFHFSFADLEQDIDVLL